MVAAQPHYEALQSGAENLGEPMIRWIRGLARSSVSLIHGDIEDAEHVGLRAAQFAKSTGQPDAGLFRAQVLFGVRIEQDRLDEIRPLWLELVEEYPHVRGVHAILAWLDSEVGHRDAARERFEQLASSDFSDVPLDEMWLLTVASAAVVANHLEDQSRAATLHTLLHPYADQIAGVGQLWVGSVRHHLALLATTAGAFDGADEQFTAASAVHQRMGAPIWLARTRLEWARMLLTRHQPGDTDRSQDLLTQALGAARDLGLASVERQAVALLDAT
jgi:hypothetical protein